MPDLSQLSLPVLALVVIGVCVLYALVGVIVVRRLMHGRVREGHNDVLNVIFATVGVLYAVLLASLVIEVLGQYDHALANSAQEASVLTTMYRQTNGMQPEEQKQMREYLRAYTEAVIDPEWDLQRDGTASPEARKQIGNIFRAYSTLDPVQANNALNQEFLHNSSILAADRNQRALASEEELPNVLWWGLLAGGFIVVGMTFLLYMERIWPHVLFSAVFAGTIGLMLFVTLALDHPFYGQLAITPHDFEHSISVFDSVDKGN